MRSVCCVVSEVFVPVGRALVVSPDAVGVSSMLSLVRLVLDGVRDLVAFENAHLAHPPSYLRGVSSRSSPAQH